MNLTRLAFALGIVFTSCISSHAVDTTRYALIAASSVIEEPPLPVLKSLPTSTTRWWLRPAIVPREVSLGVALKDENLMNWTPMSIEALGYDIRDVWRMQGEVWTFGGLTFSR